MSTFFDALVKMSMQGVVIILIVLLVRLLLQRVCVRHKYIVGLWMIAFFYLVFPWKLSLPVGFWGNGSIMEEQREPGNRTDIYVSSEDDSLNIANSAGNSEEDAARNSVGNTAGNISGSPAGHGITMGDSSAGEKSVRGHDTRSWAGGDLRGTLPFIWLFVLAGLTGHFAYSYFAIRKKLLLSIPYEGNIWWAENISTPMVFGLIKPKIYLPVSVGRENLSYIIEHEEMHIQRKDALLKMLAYVICMIHWFNPLVWAAYLFMGSDIEKACDEEVIGCMEEENRKEYAYALLRIASGETAKKKRIFVAPICFDEGNVRGRIKNVVKYREVLPEIGAAAVMVGLVLAGLFMTQTESRAEEIGVESGNPVPAQKAEAPENPGGEEASGELHMEYPAFYVEDMDTLQMTDTFSLEDYYITSRFTASNHFYIDENGTLWGLGMNEYGQLGTGSYGMEEYYEEPVKIAENVVSVDASWNDYFCIYLTENGELYGVGSNNAGVLLGEDSEKDVFSNWDYKKVTTPVLLMSDVVYARAGMECIVALRTDKSAYWWGQYAPLTHTSANESGSDYWKLEEDAANPVKMFAGKPLKIMENCKYITTGIFTGAAISEAGELYTWGFNIFGQCGTEVTEDDFVRTPVKVMDDVKMVWVDKIEFNDPSTKPSDIIRRDMDYVYNTFVLTNDDSLLAAGLNLGNKEKLTEVNGDLTETRLNIYADTFMPVRAVEYSENAKQGLNQLAFGMTMEEAEEVLGNSGLSSFRVLEDDEAYLCIADSRYFSYFNSDGQFYRLRIQEGGSRDGRFMLEMSLAELTEVVENAGGMLTKDASADDTYLYYDNENNIKYEFFIYDDKLSVLWEEAMVVYEQKGI